MNKDQMKKKWKLDFVKQMGALLAYIANGPQTFRVDIKL